MVIGVFLPLHLSSFILHPFCFAPPRPHSRDHGRAARRRRRGARAGKHRRGGRPLGRFAARVPRRGNHRPGREHAAAGVHQRPLPPRLFRAAPRHHAAGGVCGMGRAHQRPEAFARRRRLPPGHRPRLPRVRALGRDDAAQRRVLPRADVEDARAAAADVVVLRDDRRAPRDPHRGTRHRRAALFPGTSAGKPPRLARRPGPEPARAVHRLGRRCTA